MECYELSLKFQNQNQNLALIIWILWFLIFGIQIFQYFSLKQCHDSWCTNFGIIKPTWHVEFDVKISFSTLHIYFYIRSRCGASHGVFWCWNLTLWSNEILGTNLSKNNRKIIWMKWVFFWLIDLHWNI